MIFFMNQVDKLSVVIPCFNEGETIVSSFSVIKEILDKYRSEGLISDYEMVFVNDGSNDNTFSILNDLYNKNREVVVVDLRKNVGFQGALTAGLFSATGEMIVTIDADLQDDPNKIGEMIEKYYDGYEMVLGIRTNRDSDSFIKKITANIYYSLLNFFGVATVPQHADFRLLSRELVNELKKFPERVRFLRALIFEVENRYACVYYKREKRKLGHSKFTFKKLLSLAIDGITSFSNVPIRIISTVGLMMSLLSLFGLIYVFILKYVLRAVIPGWISMVVIMLFFGGMQNLFLGLIGEYISKLYMEVKQRPIFIIRKLYKHK